MRGRTALSLAGVFFVSIVAGALAISQSTAQKPADKSGIEVVLASEVVFQPLNPARGDASPQAGVLWGDIAKNVPSGVLLKFADGFSSPPHIHNITYRAVVISGAIYNGDADAGKIWLGPLSFWTQPAGGPHITAAAKGGATAFLEILEGPYLVQPTDKAFDNGERPLNLDGSNIVWLNGSDITWINQSGTPASGDGPQMAFLWGTPQEGQKNGTFVRLPAGFAGRIRNHGSQFRAVAIQGKARHHGTEAKTLEPGSCFGSAGKAEYKITCEGPEACVLYVRLEGKYDIIPAQPR